MLCPKRSRHREDEKTCHFGFYLLADACETVLLVNPQRIVSLLVQNCCDVLWSNGVETFCLYKTIKISTGQFNGGIFFSLSFGDKASCMILLFL